MRYPTNCSSVQVVDSCTIEGYRFSEGWARDQHVYFRTRFSKPFKSVQMDSTEVKLKGQKIGMAYVAQFNFDTQAGDQLVLATSLSSVSAEGAAKNLQAEAPHNDFDRYVTEAKAEWNKQLGKIEVQGNDAEDKVKFYTALYHSMLAPTIFSDVDGSYRGADKQIHQTDGWVNYSTFSLWDTYRASHPLFTYTEPERTNDMIKTFLAFYEQHGRLPLWPLWGAETEMMIGYHAVPVIVDAYLKGIGDFDAEKALEACVASADMDSYRGVGPYLITLPSKAKKTGRCPNLWNMLTMITVLPAWPKRWERQTLPSVSMTVLRIIANSSIRKPGSCSRRMIRENSFLISIRMITLNTSAKAMPGIISGLYSRTRKV